MAANYLHGCDAVVGVFDATRRQQVGRCQRARCRSSVRTHACSCKQGRRQRPGADANACAAHGVAAAPQTLGQLCEWLALLPQLFGAGALPLIAVVANKADATGEQQQQQQDSLACCLPPVCSGACW